MKMGSEYANKWSVENVVKKYSDHIAFPIYYIIQRLKDKKEEQIIDQVNSASAFWKKNTKSEA